MYVKIKRISLLCNVSARTQIARSKLRHIEETTYLKIAMFEFDKLNRKLTDLKEKCTKLKNSINLNLTEPELYLNIQGIKSQLQKLNVNEIEILAVET